MPWAKARGDAHRDNAAFLAQVCQRVTEQFTRITGDGSVPQLVFVRDGEIVRTWATVFPDADELDGLLASE